MIFDFVLKCSIVLEIHDSTHRHSLFLVCCVLLCLRAVMTAYCSPAAQGPFDVASVNLASGSYSIVQSLSGTLNISCNAGYAYTALNRMAFFVSAVCTAANYTSGVWKTAQSCSSARVALALKCRPSN